MEDQCDTLYWSGIREPVAYPPYLTAVLIVTDLLLFPLLPDFLMAEVAKSRSSEVFTPPEPSPFPITTLEALSMHISLFIAQA